MKANRSVADCAARPSAWKPTPSTGTDRSRDLVAALVASAFSTPLTLIVTLVTGVRRIAATLRHHAGRPHRTARRRLLIDLPIHRGVSPLIVPGEVAADF